MVAKVVEDEDLYHSPDALAPAALLPNPQAGSAPFLEIGIGKSREEREKVRVGVVLLLEVGLGF